MVCCLVPSARVTPAVHTRSTQDAARHKKAGSADCGAAGPARLRVCTQRTLARTGVVDNAADGVRDDIGGDAAVVAVPRGAARVLLGGGGRILERLFVVACQRAAPALAAAHARNPREDPPSLHGAAPRTSPPAANPTLPAATACRCSRAACNRSRAPATRRAPRLLPGCGRNCSLTRDAADDVVRRVDGLVLEAEAAGVRHRERLQVVHRVQVVEELYVRKHCATARAGPATVSDAREAAVAGARGGRLAGAASSVWAHTLPDLAAAHLWAELTVTPIQ